MSIKKGVLCFLIHKSYVRSIKNYCFVSKYAAIPVQLEIFILQYIGRCVLIIWTFIVNKFGCLLLSFIMWPANFSYPLDVALALIKAAHQ